MSDQAPELAADATELARRYDGAIGIGEPHDRYDIDRGHERCITYCLTPGQRRRGVRCPSCYGPVAIRAITGDEVEPAGTRWAWWWGAFLGGWAATFRHEVAPVMSIRPPRHPEKSTDELPDSGPDSSDRGHETGPQVSHENASSV